MGLFDNVVGTLKSGADSPRPIKLRKKPSSGQWFLIGVPPCLADIRIPKSEDKWA